MFRLMIGRMFSETKMFRLMIGRMFSETKMFKQKMKVHFRPWNLSQGLRHVVRIPGAQFLAPELLCEPSYERLKVQKTRFRISKRQHDWKKWKFISGVLTYLVASGMKNSCGELDSQLRKRSVSRVRACSVLKTPKIEFRNASMIVKTCACAYTCVYEWDFARHPKHHIPIIYNVWNPVPEALNRVILVQLSLVYIPKGFGWRGTTFRKYKTVVEQIPDTNHVAAAAAAAAAKNSLPGSRALVNSRAQGGAIIRS